MSLKSQERASGDRWPEKSGNLSANLRGITSGLKRAWNLQSKRWFSSSSGRFAPGRLWRLLARSANFSSAPPECPDALGRAKAPEYRVLIALSRHCSAREVLDSGFDPFSILRCAKTRSEVE